MLLSLDKPQKSHPTSEHNAYYSADCTAAGTYVPNMSDEDKQKWKAKVILKGADPRVEIRKTVGGVQLLIVVRRASVAISANGKLEFFNATFDQLNVVVDEARLLLAK